MANRSANEEAYIPIHNVPKPSQELPRNQTSTQEDKQTLEFAPDEGHLAWVPGRHAEILLFEWRDKITVANAVMH